MGKTPMIIDQIAVERVQTDPVKKVCAVRNEIKISKARG